MRILGLLMLLGVMFGCSGDKVSETAPVAADVLAKRNGDKFAVSFAFYMPISEILNGKENKGFGKKPLVVDFPNIDGIAMSESSENANSKKYLAEIDSLNKDYTVTFMRKDGEYRGVFNIKDSDLGKAVTMKFRRTEK